MNQQMFPPAFAPAMPDPAPHTVEVLVPLPFGQGFDYLVPPDMSVNPGDYVLVPFGKKQVGGVVWGPGAGGVAAGKLKAISARLGHIPPLGEAQRRFIDWAAWYNFAAKGAVLKMLLCAPEALQPPASVTCYALADPLPEYRRTASREKIIALLRDGAVRTRREIVDATGAGAEVVQSLVKAGVLRAQEMAAATPAPAYRTHLEDVQFSPAQSEGAEQLKALLGKGFGVTVLDGVTGSGKTEVYFAAIAEALARGGQVLVLLPEIALSVQWLRRFEERFGAPPHLWHSGVTPGRKAHTWRAIADGTARVVVGARSALFLPYGHLSLIVVDEEHEPSYKQEDGVIYQARDMAIARAHHEQIPVVLVSATPSLETATNIAQGKFAELRLPERHGGAQLPSIELVDMRASVLAAQQFLSTELRRALAHTVAAGRQAMLFLNRRGYAPLVLCRACGYRFQCPSCTAWLVYHRHRPRLQCHHCGHTAPAPKACPACNEPDTLQPCGPGVERVAEELRDVLPQARIAVMTSDAASSPQEVKAIIAGMESGQIDILIGTQMIAKGHHFPNLGLVGVVDADLGLAGGDLRAGERTYQLLHQLSGRAGRETLAGHVILQSYMPEHPVMQALVSGARDRFMALEAQQREQAGMPPYGRLAALILDGTSEQEVAAFSRELARQAPQLRAIRVLGPAPAPLSLLRGRYRYRLLVKAPRNVSIQAYLSDWLARVMPSSRVRIKVDIDPYSFS